MRDLERACELPMSSGGLDLIHELLQECLLVYSPQSIKDLAKECRVTRVIALLSVDFVEYMLDLLVCENTPKLVLDTILQT